MAFRRQGCGRRDGGKVRLASAQSSVSSPSVEPGNVAFEAEKPSFREEHVETGQSASTNINLQMIPSLRRDIIWIRHAPIAQDCVFLIRHFLLPAGILQVRVGFRSCVSPRLVKETRFVESSACVVCWVLGVAGPGCVGIRR